MLSRENKAQKIASFGEKVQSAEAVLIAENAGLTAQEMAVLRRKLRAGGGSAQVMKNTLAKRVLTGSRFSGLAEHLSGPLVYGTGEDPAQVAKIFTDLARENPKFIVRGGALPEKEVMAPAAVTALAKLPSREQLLARLAGAMQAPVSKFVSTLNAVPSGFVRALAAVRDKAADSDSGK